MFEWNSDFNVFQSTALAIAVEKRNIETIKLLLDNPKIDVNIKSIWKKKYFIHNVLKYNYFHQISIIKSFLIEFQFQKNFFFLSNCTSKIWIKFQSIFFNRIPNIPIFLNTISNIISNVISKINIFFNPIIF